MCRGGSCGVGVLDMGHLSTFWDGLWAFIRPANIDLSPRYSYASRSPAFERLHYRRATSDTFFHFI